MTVSVVIDSASSGLVYAGTQWTADTDPSTFFGTYDICITNATLVTPPTMTFAFDGTGVSFFGQPSNDFKFNYSIDEVPVQAAVMDFTPGISGKTGVQVWATENLATDLHSMTLIPTAGQLILDYIVVTPSSSTSLDYDILAFDDTDSAIKYNGSWTSDSGTVYPNGLSFNNTRHGSTTPGDSLIVYFTGSSIAVYGLLDENIGNHSSSYIVDNGTPYTYEYSYNTAEPGQSNTWLLHQKFFSQSVTPGDHNLTVTVNEVSGAQTFWLDYILFEGTSTTLLTPPAPPSTTASKLNKKTIAILASLGTFFFLLICMRYRYKLWNTKRRSRVSRGPAASSIDSANRATAYLPVVSAPPHRPVTPVLFTPPLPLTPLPNDHVNENIHLHELQNLARDEESAIGVDATGPQDAGPADPPPPYNPDNYIP